MALNVGSQVSTFSASPQFLHSFKLCPIFVWKNNKKLIIIGALRTCALDPACAGMMDFTFFSLYHWW
ncbi:hypothetical protein [Coxiella burnetii]|uniref:hypothetical protein n=1 Tax=Coxiella burnetii TaxID=777 RepID=UPI000183D075|nr:hypothetical protein [Coxiella burnetii]ACJ17669.1 hypothetical protein CbuG_0225 [Coxiella burnetii CbuG_Q212]ATN66123.1 hypothetical protein AYM17_01055 [Coxiella burnetii]OYK86949.1 hypothetical protein CbuQ229_01130 [Coxiella burnetii]